MNNTPTTTERTQATSSKQAGAIATRQGTTRGELQELLSKYKTQIRMALPRHLTPERIIRVAMTACSRNPKLLECTKESLIGSIVQSSSLGLEPDSVLGHAHLVPFYNNRLKRMEALFVPGYRGYIELARRSGNIENITAQVVCERDVFEYEFGLNEKLRHKPASENRGRVTHAYAYARFKNGGYGFEVMVKEEIDQVMQQSKSRDRDGKITGPWVTHYEAMARKTVIRRLAKYLPLSVEFARAVALDEAAQRGEQANDLSTIDVNTGEIFNPEFTVEEGTDAEGEHASESTTSPSPQIGTEAYQKLLKQVETAKTKGSLEQLARKRQEALGTGEITEVQSNELLRALEAKQQQLEQASHGR